MISVGHRFPGFSIGFRCQGGGLLKTVHAPVDGGQLEGTSNTLGTGTPMAVVHAWGAPRNTAANDKYLRKMTQGTKKF